jgi:hypothetical protein
MPWPIREIGLTHRLLAESLAQLSGSREKLLRACHKRTLYATAILRCAALGSELAYRGGDLKQLSSGVLLLGRKAVARGDLLRDLLKGERQVKLGGAGGVAQRGEVVGLIRGAHAPVIPSTRRS